MVYEYFLSTGDLDFVRVNFFKDAFIGFGIVFLGAAAYVGKGAQFLAVASIAIFRGFGHESNPISIFSISSPNEISSSGILSGGHGIGSGNRFRKFAFISKVFEEIKSRF